MAEVPGSKLSPWRTLTMKVKPRMGPTAVLPSGKCIAQALFTAVLLSLVLTTEDSLGEAPCLVSPQSPASFDSGEDAHNGVLPKRPHSGTTYSQAEEAPSRNRRLCLPARFVTFSYGRQWFSLSEINHLLQENGLPRLPTSRETSGISFSTTTGSLVWGFSYEESSASIPASRLLLSLSERSYSFIARYVAARTHGLRIGPKLGLAVSKQSLEIEKSDLPDFSSLVGAPEMGMWATRATYIGDVGLGIDAFVRAPKTFRNIGLTHVGLGLIAGYQTDLERSKWMAGEAGNRETPANLHAGPFLEVSLVYGLGCAKCLVEIGNNDISGPTELH